MSSPDISGAWSLAQTDRFLREVRVPLRLACSGNEGHPRLVSLWFEWDGRRLWCATQESAQTARWIEDAPEVAFEVSPDEPPYRGVRGTGTASIVAERGKEQRERLLDRYDIDREGKLGSFLLERASTEVALRIEPQRMSTWDFTDRMSDDA